MAFKGIVAILGVFCMLFCRMASADDQVLDLLNEMRAEIRTLKVQADRSEARIKELESQLVQERGHKGQASTLAPVAAKNPIEEPTRGAIANADAPAIAQDGGMVSARSNAAAQYQLGEPAPVIIANDNLIRGKGGVTEGGAPEPPRVGKEIIPGVSATFGGYIESASLYRSKFEGQDVNSNYNTSIPFENNANAHQPNSGNRPDSLGYRCC